MLFTLGGRRRSLPCSVNGVGSHGWCSCWPAGRRSSERPCQPWRDRAGGASRAGGPGSGRDGQGERARARPAGAGDVYYAIALALYMGSSTREVLRCLLEGLRWLWGAEAVKVAGKSGISQARSRLGEAPLRRLYEQVVQPIAARATKGAWYRQWRLVSLDGSCLDVGDTAENGAHFGYPGASRGESAFPQLRFVALVENGTHVLFGAQLGRYGDSETTLAHDVLGALRRGMLCLADRQFFGHALWQRAASTGADLLWRVKCNRRLPRETVLADGSYLTTVYPSEKDRRHRTGGVRVRVVEYRLGGGGAGAA